MALFVAVPATVAEKISLAQALRRSVDLTNGFWGVIFICSIVVNVLDKIMEKIGESMMGADIVTNFFILLGFLMIPAALRAVMAAVAYVRLRQSKDGMDIGDLAKIFE